MCKVCVCVCVCVYIYITLPQKQHFLKVSIYTMKHIQYSSICVLSLIHADVNKKRQEDLCDFITVMRI